MSMKIGETKKCWDWKQVDGIWKWVYEDFTYTGEQESGYPTPIIKLSNDKNGKNIVICKEFEIIRTDEDMKIGQYVIQ